MYHPPIRAKFSKSWCRPLLGLSVTDAADHLGVSLRQNASTLVSSAVQTGLTGQVTTNFSEIGILLQSKGRQVAPRLETIGLSRYFAMMTENAHALSPDELRRRLQPFCENTVSIDWRCLVRQRAAMCVRTVTLICW